MSNHYNLLDSPWIPILYDNGRAQRAGISAVLKHSHRIRDIATSNPMDRFAVLRFLLAVLYCCKGNPTEGDKQVKQFPPEWFDKLEENRECFNLLGAGRRFYQSEIVRDDKPDSVFPTHVGVNRRERPLEVVSEGIPHARGGEPFGIVEPHLLKSRPCLP